MNKQIVVSLAALFAGSVFGAGISDALVYDMALVPTEGTVPTTAIYDRLTHSAATRATATSMPVFSGDTAKGTPEQLSIATAQKSLPIYGTKIPPQTETMLNFPQSNVDVDGTLYTYRQVVKVSDVALSSNMTVYCRIYPDTSIYDDVAGEKSSQTISILDFDTKMCNEAGKPKPCGFKLCLYKSANDGVYPYVYCGYTYASQLGGPVLSKSSFSTGIDFVVVFETEPDATFTWLTIYIAQDGVVKTNGKRQLKSLWYPSNTPQVLGFQSGNFAIGGLFADIGKTDWTALDSNKKTKRNTYRGGISRLKIFNRPLTEAEIHGLMTAANGGAAVIGTANGSTDEFAVEGEEESVFNPYTMESSKMRGVLTAANPSLTIDCPSKGADEGLAKCLAVTPVLDELADGSASVDVAVNGRSVGSLDLASSSSRRLYIKGKNIATNGQGCVRYTLTRRGNLTGKLGIDAIEIAGSWQEGFPRVGGSDVTRAFGQNDDAKVLSYVGHPAATNYLNGSLYGTTKTQFKTSAQTIEFYVPEEIALKLKSRCQFGISSLYVYKAGSYPCVDTYLNGVKYGETVPSLIYGEVLTREFPAGTLLPGFNSLTFSNATPYEVSVATKENPLIFPSFYRFTYEDPKLGLMLIVR